MIILFNFYFLCIILNYFIQYLSKVHFNRNILLKIKNFTLIPFLKDYIFQKYLYFNQK
jgi:hypothetical protein